MGDEKAASSPLSHSWAMAACTSLLVPFTALCVGVTCCPPAQSHRVSRQRCTFFSRHPAPPPPPTAKPPSLERRPPLPQSPHPRVLSHARSPTLNQTFITNSMQHEDQGERGGEGGGKCSERGGGGVQAREPGSMQAKGRGGVDRGGGAGSEVSEKGRRINNRSGRGARGGAA